jgi:lipoprotein-anchoring transpeptidase ErfK/SrfK
MKSRMNIGTVALVAGAVVAGGVIVLRMALPSAMGANAGVQAGRPPVVAAAAVAPGIEVSAPAATPAKPAEVEAGKPAEKPAESPQPAASPAPVTHGKGDLAEARILLAEGRKFEARAVLTKLVLASPEGPAREELRRSLDGVNKDLFFSRAPSPDSDFHTVARNEPLDRISRQYGKDRYFSNVIMLVNGLVDPKRVRVGQKLKIPKGTFSALVQKHAHRLIILLDGNYIKEYPVALGAPQSPTPEVKFVVDRKSVNPDWTSPDGVYKFGDPKNILGTRWIGFQDTPELHSYGIHGTSDPETVGKDVSNGCVRMRNADVEEIFGMLMAGDTVEIAK